MAATAINYGEAKMFYKAMRIYYSSVLEEIRPKIVKPEPVLKHTIFLPALLKRFSELKEISQAAIVGVHDGREAVELRTLFIAIAIRLYDPQPLTGLHTDQMKSNLAEELAGLLKTERSWISQKATEIRAFLNPHKPKPAYEDFKEEVNKIAKVLEIEFAK